MVNEIASKNQLFLFCLGVSKPRYDFTLTMFVEREAFCVTKYINQTESMSQYYIPSELEIDS